jgi:hypothetical protein
MPPELACGPVARDTGHRQGADSDRLEHHGCRTSTAPREGMTINGRPHRQARSRWKRPAADPHMPDVGIRAECGGERLTAAPSRPCRTESRDVRSSHCRPGRSARAGPWPRRGRTDTAPDAVDHQRPTARERRCRRRHRARRTQHAPTSEDSSHPLSSPKSPIRRAQGARDRITETAITRETVSPPPPLG